MTGYRLKDTSMKISTYITVLPTKTYERIAVQPALIGFHFSAFLFQLSLVVG